MIIKKILNDKELFSREKRCLGDSVNYYNYWSHKQVNKALKQSSKLYCHTFETH